MVCEGRYLKQRLLVRVYYTLRCTYRKKKAFSKKCPNPRNITRRAGHRLIFRVSPLICVNKQAYVGKVHCIEPVCGTDCLKTSEYFWIPSPNNH
jgi:hypothetical protein